MPPTTASTATGTSSASSCLKADCGRHGDLLHRPHLDPDGGQHDPQRRQLRGSGGGEGTFTYTAGVAIPAGTVITITTAQLTAAGINLSDSGDTIYIYQGTDANTPTKFLFAMEVGDGNTTFNSSLVNTGLVAGVHTVSIAHDQGIYQYQGLGAPAAQLASIVDHNHWYGNDTNDLSANLYDDRIYIERSGPLNAGDMQLFGAMTGGGQADAIVRVDNDFNDTGSNVGTNLARLLRDHPAFISMEDIAFDLEDGVWFAVMNEGTDITRIVKGQHRRPARRQ
jgi:hypothetical protein